MRTFTLDTLKKIMREAAGEDEIASLDGDFEQLSFTDLGYDSLALMETASWVEREFGLALPEEEMADVVTPADFVDFVNGRLAEAA
jgi:acyl carrier protein